MISGTSQVVDAAAGLPWLAAEFMRREPRLTVLGLAFLAFLPLALAGALLDGRMLDGVNVWVKPAKFLASLAMFALTMAWFAGYIDAQSRSSAPMQAVSWTIIATALFEMVYIGVQAARGEASHFNTGTPFHRGMYAAMGIAAVILTATTLVYAHAVWRHAAQPIQPAFQLSLVLGLVLTAVLGIVTGLRMGGTTSHFVSAAGAAGTLPVLGWSTTGGDWRVAHFLGIHAQQLLPFAGALVACVYPGRTGIVIVAAIALGYVLLTGAAMVQAAADRPLITF